LQALIWNACCFKTFIQYKIIGNLILGFTQAHKYDREKENSRPGGGKMLVWPVQRPNRNAADGV
jgi:hypothetical protein